MYARIPRIGKRYASLAIVLFPIPQLVLSGNLPPTTFNRNSGAPHTPTINTTDPMPISCTSAPPNHHAHLGSSYQLTSDRTNLPQPHGEHGNSYTVPTPILNTLQLLGLSISKAYSSLLCNDMFQLHPTAPAFDLFFSSLRKIHTP